MDLSGILCSLLIPEYSGIERRGKPLPRLRNPGISFVSFLYSGKYPLPFYGPYGKSDHLQLSLFHKDDLKTFLVSFDFVSAANSHLIRQYKYLHNVK